MQENLNNYLWLLPSYNIKKRKSTADHQAFGEKAVKIKKNFLGNISIKRKSHKTPTIINTSVSERYLRRS